MEGKYILYFIIILIIVLLDQIIKYTALVHLREGQIITVLRGGVQFVLVKNTGAAFSILRGRQTLLKTITVPLIAFIFVYLLYNYYVGSISILPGIALAFITGGALGNLVDRMRFNYVVDYIRFNIRRFPVFNLADVFIFTGAVMYIIYSFKYQILL